MPRTPLKIPPNMLEPPPPENEFVIPLKILLIEVPKLLNVSPIKEPKSEKPVLSFSNI